MARTYPTREISVGTKVSADQAARYRHAAGEKALSAWVREVLDAHLTRAPLEELLLAEVLALRAIVLNVQHDLAAQRPVTVDRTLQHIAEADRTKYARPSSATGAVPVSPRGRPSGARLAAPATAQPRAGGPPSAIGCSSPRRFAISTSPTASSGPSRRSRPAL